jgi:hypothetical protein
MLYNMGQKVKIEHGAKAGNTRRRDVGFGYLVSDT